MYAAGVGALGRGLTLFVLLLVADAASAAQSHGEVELTRLSLPQATLAEGASLALWLNDSAPAREFNLTAPQLAVTTYRSRSVAASVGGNEFHYDVPDAPQRREYHNATLRLSPTGAHEGWLGLYPTLAHARMETARDVGAAARRPGHVGNSHAPEQPRQPDMPLYGQPVEAPHILLAATGRVVVVGSGALKIMGLDLVLDAAEGSTTIRSHPPTQPELGAGESQQVWAYVEFADGASLSLDAGPSPVVVALPRVMVAWSGVASLAGARGYVQADGARYDLAAGSHQLRGNLMGQMAALGPPASPVALLSLQGELEGASGRLVAGPAPPAARGPPWGLGVLGLAVVALAAGAWGAYGRARRPRGVVDVDRVGSALEEPGAALYAAAAVEVSFEQHDAAMDALQKAVRAEPILALRAREDPAFAPLRGRPDWLPMLDAALRRAGLRR